MRVGRMIGRAVVILMAGLVAMTVTACAPSAEASDKASESTVVEAAPQQVTIVAKNYLFVAPDTIQSGMTTFHLENHGTEHHHVQLVRLSGGKTLDDLLAAMQSNPEAIPPFATLVGGPNSPEPAGGHSIGTVDLEPGNYALLCFIPTAEGVPHVVKGMSRAMVVVPSTGPAISPPQFDATVTLEDYKFGVSAQLTAGTRTIKVENRALQGHEVFIVRLEPGATKEQVLQSIMGGMREIPAQAIGGTTFIQSGGVNYITVDLQPGKYAFFCFVPDAKDGKPHVAHGMMQEITVN